MVTRYGDLQGITGQLTAHGTITAAVSTLVTAEVRGFVTASVTAGTPIGVSGQVTATVQGLDLSGVSASARPVLIGGYNATTAQPAELRLTQGPGGTLAASLNGLVANAQLFAASRNVGAPAAIESEPHSDGMTNAGTHLRVIAHQYGWNGVTHDRTRNNATAVLLASTSDIAGARTAADQVNYNHPGVMLWLNIYGTAGTATIGGVIVQGKHNDKYATLTAFARTLTAPGLYPFAFHPGAGAGTLVSGAAPMILPRDWRAIVSGALDANASASYQLDAHYVGYG